MNNGYYTLYLRVAIRRRRLEELVGKYGHRDPRVVKFSQQLDQDMAELQRRRLAG